MTVFQKQESIVGSAINFLSDATFDATLGANTLIGSAVTVSARNLDTNEAVQGSCSVVSATVVRCAFAAGALSVGTWEMLVTATPPGYPSQIVAASEWNIKP